MCQCFMSNISSAAIRKCVYINKHSWKWNVQDTYEFYTHQRVSLLTGWFVYNATFDRCRNKIAARDISAGMWMCFWLAVLFKTTYLYASLVTKPRSHEEFDSNPSAWDRLKMSGYKSLPGWPWGFGGCHAGWIRMWSRKPLSHDSLTSFLTFFPPPSSRLWGTGIKSCHIRCNFWTVHKRAWVKEYRMYGWWVKPRKQAVARSMVLPLMVTSGPVSHSVRRSLTDSFIPVKATIGLQYLKCQTRLPQCVCRLNPTFTTQTSVFKKLVALILVKFYVFTQIHRMYRFRHRYTYGYLK